MAKQNNLTRNILIGGGIIAVLYFILRKSNEGAGKGSGGALPPPTPSSIRPIAPVTPITPRYRPGAEFTTVTPITPRYRPGATII